MLRAASSFLGGRSQAASTLASIIFNGSNERLSIDQSATSSDRTRWTASFWMKTAATPSFPSLSPIFESYLVSNPDQFAWVYHSDTDDMTVECDSTSAAVGNEQSAASYVVVDNSWVHYLVRWNTNEGSSDNRIRLYKNGTLFADSGSAPGASGLFHFFVNGHKINVGNSDTAPLFHAKRLAFIEVLDGVDAAATEFAFDNGGTWTRKPYAGSYGTYGFRIDGSNGLNDASGNGRIFTAANMDASNLSTSDLPPYTT